MNINKFWGKIIEKWPAKLICLGLAIFLYIIYQSSLLEKKTFIVPLAVIEDGNVCVVGNIPDSISVSVRAYKDSVSQIKDSDIHATINLNQFTTSGEYTVAVNVIFEDNVLAFDPLEVTIKPEKITLNVEEKIMRYVPVIPSTVGEPAHGYMVSNVEVNPPYVPIVGPESLVMATDCVYSTRVNVSNAENNFSTQVKIFQLNKYIDIREESDFKVTVTLAQQDTTRDFDGIVVVLNNLQDNLLLQGSAPLVSVTLAGKVPFLEKYVLSRNFVTVDLSDISEAGTYEVPLKYISSTNFEIIKRSAETVKITLAEKLIEPVVDSELNEEASTGE